MSFLQTGVNKIKKLIRWEEMDDIIIGYADWELSGKKNRA